MRVNLKCALWVPLLFPVFGSKLLILWWAHKDLNLGLPPCEGGTLPLSYAPILRTLDQQSSLRVNYIQDTLPP